MTPTNQNSILHFSSVTYARSRPIGTTLLPHKRVPQLNRGQLPLVGGQTLQPPADKIQTCYRPIVSDIRPIYVIAMTSVTEIRFPNACLFM